MVQMARDATDEESAQHRGQRYLPHDRDTKFCAAFRDALCSAGVRPVMLPPHSPNLNAFAERWVRLVKEECLSKLILLVKYRYEERSRSMSTHRRGTTKASRTRSCFPTREHKRSAAKRPARCNERLGGLLKHYTRAA
jgi:transposase InsO family protein